MLKVVGWTLVLGALLPAASRAEDRLARELGGVVARIEEAGGSAGEREIAPLRPLLRELEERHARQEREFDRVARRQLPRTAIERLERTRAAHRAATLPLIEILQGFVRPPKAAATAARGTAPAPAVVQRPVGRLGEAREILRRMETSSWRAPISADMPGLKAPSLKPPTLGQASGATTSAPVGYVPQILKDAAAGMGGPVDVFTWVRNTITPEFYYGVMKGAVETYVERSGNDADTAALLVQLLRAKGVPARYVRGTVELPGATLTEICGTANVEQAVRVLERGGVPHEVVTGAGGVASVKMERVWAEAYLPYANYRGTLQDAQGGAWIPLDPAFKRLGPPIAFDVVDRLGFDPQAAWQDYLAESRATRPAEFVRARVEQLLRDKQTGATYDGILDQRSIVTRALGILPNSMPYAVTAQIETSFELPATLNHSVRFVAEREGVKVLDARFPVADVLGRRLTLSYLPFSEEDEQIATSFGGLTQTPPYLIEVKAVLRLGGIAVAGADAPLGMAVRFAFRTEIETPGGTETVENTLTAGNLAAIGLSGRQVSASESSTDSAASILAGLAWSYFDRWNASDDELARLFKVVPVRPTVSACLVTSVIDVEYAGGDPLYPLSFDWKAILIDADLRSSAPVGIVDREAEQGFTLLSGLEGSVLEHRVFEDKYQVDSISTAKALGLAAQSGITIHDVDAGNADTILPTLPFDEQVIEEVRAAVERGRHARIPAVPVSYLEWTGVGYVLLDEDTGEAAYQLQGGHSGGETAEPVPDSVLITLIKQREDPEDAKGRDVAFIIPDTATDYQDGIVNERLGLPLRVYVVDAEGYAVDEASVTFVARSGGGKLINLKSGEEGDTMTVLSDSTGAAIVALRLGERTCDWPLYTCETGITCDGENGHATQIGLNMVTAYTATAVLDGPFEAYGFPDDRGEGGERKGDYYLQYATNGGWCPNKRVAGPLLLGVKDPYDNPLSNFAVTVAYAEPPTIDPASATGNQSVCRSEVPQGAFTAGSVLKAKEYEDCAGNKTPVLQSDCPGAPSATSPTSVFGALFYPVIGDSPYSTYRFKVSDAEGEKFEQEYHTCGILCANADPNACHCKEPGVLPQLMGRGVLVNAQGNMIEAYLPEATGTMGFGTDVLYEKESIQELRDRNDVPHYFAIGTNEWVREPLDDSEFQVRPTTPGTVADGVSYVGGGKYEGAMKMGPAPQLNIAAFDYKLFPPMVPYLPRISPDVTPPEGIGHEVDPGYVDPITLELRGRVKEPGRPWTGHSDFSLWGIRPRLVELDPTPVRVAADGAVIKDSVLRGVIEPLSYWGLLDNQRQVRTDVGLGEDVQLTTWGVGMTIAKGSFMKPGDYEGKVAVSAVTRDGKDIVSDPFPVPVRPPCALLTVEKPNLIVSSTWDPWEGGRCENAEDLRFELCEAAEVTFTVVSEQNGLEKVVLAKVPYESGTHAIPISPSFLEGIDPSIVGKDGNFRYLLEARATEERTNFAQVTGQFHVSQTLNRAVLPVGRTFVKGVDLFDGHLVQQSSDLKARGRHLNLEVMRTYASSGTGAEGSMGAGWAFNYEASLTVSECTLVVVKTPDGSSQVFRRTAAGEYEPQPGYHTTLIGNDDGSFDFFDKAHVRYRFAAAPVDGGALGPRPLLYVEEPHGDRLVLTYDPETHLVSEVGEVPRGATAPIRRLEVTYYPDLIGGFRRIHTVAIAALGLGVTYEYDEHGNLTHAKSSGQNVSGRAAEPQEDTYWYSIEEERDRYQLLAHQDANRHRTEFVFFKKSDLFPGEATGEMIVLDKEEHVRLVREFPGTSSPIETSFEFDALEVLSKQHWKTTVTGPTPDRKTLYVLNLNGSPVEIHEPLGKSTFMRWATADIYKEWEKDANGRETDYGYDAKGNLTSETIHTKDASIVGSAGGDVTTSYTYHPVFGKLTSKTDGLRRPTTYTIDDTNGNLTDIYDAAGNHTHNDYDGNGCLSGVTDPRGNAISYSDCDSFGTPRHESGPGSYWKQRETDTRGRVTREWDSLGHETHTEYDGFDRPLVVRKLSGTGSDDVTHTWYYPAGQVRSVMNARGAETTYSIDGLNRVTLAATNVPDGRPFEIVTTYDESGNKETQKDERDVWRRFAYDALDRLLKVEITSSPHTLPQNRVFEYDYDKVGNKLWETNLAGLKTQYHHDGLYRVDKKTFPVRAGEQELSERYVNDAVGNRRELWDANNKPTYYDYDGLNRLTYTRNALGHETVIEYADDGGAAHVNKTLEWDKAHGLRTVLAHDELSRETRREVHLEGPGGNGRTYTTITAWAAAGGGQQATVTGEDGHVTVRVLDGLDRVVHESVQTNGSDGNLVTETEYDGLGNRTRVLDPRRHETRFAYDGLGRLLTTWDAVGNDSHATYDEGGLKVSETDRRGVTRSFTYDTIGRLTETRLESRQFSGVGWSQKTQYQDLAHRRIEWDARGNSTIFDLDSMGRVVHETDAEGYSAEQHYDGLNKDWETDKRGKKTYYYYDDIHRLIRTAFPGGQGYTTETQYRDAANIRREKDRRNLWTETQLDPLGRVVRVSREGVNLETNEYDAYGSKTYAEDGAGHKTRFSYDGANRLIARVDGADSSDAASTSYVYSDKGGSLREIDARAAAAGREFSTRRTFDALNRVASVTDGENHETAYGYDEEGNRTLVREPELQETTFTYDELGKLLRVEQPEVDVAGGARARPVTEYRYDENRNRRLQTDANDHVVEMDYDRVNRLYRTTQDRDGLKLVTLITKFDGNGNVEDLQDPKGQRIHNTYDDLNRLQQRDFTPLPEEAAKLWRYTTSIGYQHDGNGNLERAEEHVASGLGLGGTGTLTTIRVYDAFDRLKSEQSTLPQGGASVVGYDYYGNGARKSVTDPQGRITFYDYDNQNRLKTATTDYGTGQAQATTYGYYLDSLLDTVTYPNGVVAKHTYDYADRLLGITNSNGSTVVSSYGYGYTPNGNRLSQIETNGGLTETTGYTYDELNRLETIAYPGNRNVAYEYDRVGNRRFETERDGAGTVVARKEGVFDAANRLGQLTDHVDATKSATLGWDENGNQIWKTIGSGDGAVTTRNLYDARDKLIEVQQGDSTLSRFQFDFDGRRTEKIGLDTRQYVYDQTSILGELNETGTEIAKYDYGSDRLISLTHLSEGRRFYSFDALGSVTNLTNDTGSGVASYHMDAWGNFRFPAELTSSANRFAFTGYQWDQETGLYNARARFYDPTLGRFIAQDTYLGQVDDPPSLHRYYYANESPTRYIDPAGHEADEAQPQPLRGEALRQAMSEGKKVSCSEAGCFVVRPPTASTWKPVPVEDIYQNPETEEWIRREVQRLREERAWRDRNMPKVVKEGSPSDAPTFVERVLTATGNAAAYPGRKAREFVQENLTAVLQEALGVNKPRGPLTDNELAAIQSGATPEEAAHMRNPYAEAPKSLAEHGGYGGGLAAQGAVEYATGKALEGGGRVLEGVAEEARLARLARLARGEGIVLELRVKPGWSAAQIAEAEAKVQALNEAARGGLLARTKPVRSGTSAASRYTSGGGTVPVNADVDHVLDLQLGGRDVLGNMKPLDSSVNRSLGSQIYHQTKRLPMGTPIREVRVTYE